MRFRIEYVNCRHGDIVLKEYATNEVRTLADAQGYAQKLIDRFNDSLRQGESPRKLLKVTRSDNEVSVPHTWEKTNLVTKVTGGRVYDTYKCKVCGIEGKRYGISGYIAPDVRAKAVLKESCLDLAEAVPLRIRRIRRKTNG